jgi:hypothetical protein
MVKAIGPTFHAELIAAGVTDWRFTWGADGTLTFDPDCAQVALVEQVYAAHDPTRPALAVYVRPTPRQWFERLSQATQIALETAALSNAQVARWMRIATGTSDGIDVTLQETKDGVAAMVAAGLLTAAEQTTLLAP